MEQYPGASRASAKYLLNSLSSTLFAFIGVGFWSLPALLIAYFAGGKYATFAFLAWTGWAVLIGQGTLSTDSSNSLEESSKKEKLMASVFAFLYFSTVTLVSVLFGSLALNSGYPVLATGIAFIYPSYDILVGEKRIPLSVLGIIVLVATLLNALHALTHLVGEGLRLPGRFVRKGPGGMIG